MKIMWYDQKLQILIYRDFILEFFMSFGPPYILHENDTKLFNMFLKENVVKCYFNVKIWLWLLKEVKYFSLKPLISL